VDEVPVLDGDPIESPDFEVSFEELGTAQVMVRAYAPDGRTARAFSKVEITNRPPSLSVAGIPSQVHRNQVIFPDIKAEDPDGDEVELEIASLEDGAIASSKKPEFALKKLGEIRLVLTARDSFGAVKELPVIVAVTNRPPSVTLPSSPLRAHPGQVVEIATTPTDPDGDQTSARAFAQGAELEQASPGVFRFVPSTPGLHEVRVEVSDEHGSASTASSSIEVSNRPPEITLPSVPPSVRRGDRVKLVAPPVDPDGDPVTVSAVIGGEEKNWSPGEEVTAAFSSLGTHEVEIVAVDSRGSRSTAKLEVLVVNAPPTVELSITPEAPHKGAQVKVVAIAVDPEGEPLLYKFGGDGVPSSPTTSPETTVTPSELGKLTVSVSVSDPHGEVTSAKKTIEVLPRPPEVSISASPTEGSRTNEFSATVTYRCPEGDKPPRSMKILEPSTWDRTTNGFAGRFKSVGEQKIRVEVESSSGATGVAETSVTVTNLPPSAEMLAPASPHHRPRPTRFAVKYDDPDGGRMPTSVKWEVDGGRVVSEDALTAVIEFERLGEISVSATVTDSEGAATKTTTRPQVENVPPSIRATVPGGPHHRMQPIPIKVEAVDTDGSAPPTLEVSMDGQPLVPLDGVYQLRPSRLGHHSLKVVAVDSDGSRTEESLPLEVENSPPTVKLATPPDTQEVGREVTLSATASDLEGGNLGYEFEVNGVRLPSSEAGETKVSFASPGRHPVSVTVTDPDGAKVTALGEVRVK
jgi:PKD repeat protein